MFKKKQNLPPRPQPPTNDQISIDICNMKNNDEVMTFANSQNRTDKGVDEIESAYRQLKMFLEINDNLGDLVNDLKIESVKALNYNKTLEESVKSLEEKAANVLPNLS